MVMRWTGKAAIYLGFSAPVDRGIFRPVSGKPVERLLMTPETGMPRGSGLITVNQPWIEGAAYTLRPMIG